MICRGKGCVGMILLLPALTQGPLAMSAVKEPVRLVPPNEIEGWRVVSAPGREVTAKTIFDYMNGAGEIYLAYDFVRLQVWSYQRDGDSTITVEAYEMGTPTEAFGVLSHDLEGQNVKIGQQSAYGAGLLRFWKARWYFRILAELETPQTRRAVLALGRALAAQIPREGQRPQLLSPLPSDGLQPHTIHYFHTHLCLNAFYFFAVENLLELDAKTEAVLADYRVGSDSAKLLLIRYPEASAAGKALGQFRKGYLSGLPLSDPPLQVAQLENGEWVGMRREGRCLAVVFKSRSRDITQRLLGAVDLSKGGKTP